MIRGCHVRPRTQYVDSGGYAIAYQVNGDGPLDVLFSKACCRISTCNGAIRLRRVPESARLVFTPRRDGSTRRRPFRRAGTIPTIDERVADLAAVADAVGSKRMFLIASASAPSCSPTLSTPHKRQPGTATSAGRYCSCATTLQCAKRSIVAAENA